MDFIQITNYFLMGFRKAVSVLGNLCCGYIDYTAILGWYGPSSKSKQAAGVSKIVYLGD